MNKLTALYELMQNMKALDCPTGHMNSELKFGETVIVKGFAESITEEGKQIKKTEINMGEESIKFERAGNTMGGCHGGFGHYGMHKGMKHHRSMQSNMHSEMIHKMYSGSMNCDNQNQDCHMRIKGGKLSKAMLFIKLLDKTVYDEKAKQFSLELSPSDMSESMKAQFEEHLAYKKEHIKSMMSSCEESDCCCDEHHQKLFKHLIDAGIKEVNLDSITPNKVNLVIKVDESIKPIEINFDALVDTKLKSGDERPIHFSLKGKML